jgi:hypothetical protein
MFNMVDCANPLIHGPRDEARFLFDCLREDIGEEVQHGIVLSVSLKFKSLFFNSVICPNELFDYVKLFSECMY